VNKFPRVLVFSIVAAGCTVLNTLLLLGVLLRGNPASSTGPSVQNNPSAQSAARAALCSMWSSKGETSDPSPLSDMAQFHCTRADAEALLQNAGEDQEAKRFRCSSTGAVE